MDFKRFRLRYLFFCFFSSYVIFYVEILTLLNVCSENDRFRPHALITIHNFHLKILEKRHTCDVQNPLDSLYVLNATVG